MHSPHFVGTYTYAAAEETIYGLCKGLNLEEHELGPEMNKMIGPMAGEIAAGIVDYYREELAEAQRGGTWQAQRVILERGCGATRRRGREPNITSPQRADRYRGLIKRKPERLILIGVVGFRQEITTPTGKAFSSEENIARQSRKNSATCRRKVTTRHRRAGRWRARRGPMLNSGKVHYEVGGTSTDRLCRARFLISAPHAVESFTSGYGRSAMVVKRSGDDVTKVERFR